MKANILFFALGAVLMFVAMQVFDKPDSRPIDVTQTVSQSADPAIIEEKSAKPLGDEMVLDGENSIAPSTSTDSRQFMVATELPEGLANYMIDSRIESFKSNFSSALGDDTVKLNLLAELAETKIRKDLEVTNKLMTGQFDGQNYDLLNKNEADLSADELLRKREIELSFKEMEEARKQNRIEYEDSLKNLLTERELDDYRKEEMQQVQDLFSKQASALATNVKIVVKDLSNYQRSELDRIVAEVSDLKIDSVPLGSSLGSGFGADIAELSAFFENFHNQLADILSAAQIKTLEESQSPMFVSQ